MPRAWLPRGANEGDESRLALSPNTDSTQIALSIDREETERRREEAQAWLRHHAESRRGRPRAVKRALVLFILLFASFGFAQLELTFLDVGQGDGVLIRSPSGQMVLYDGVRKDGRVLDYLRELGMQSLDLVIASYPDANRIGGL